MNTEEDYRRAFESGATGVMTDYPSKLKDFLIENPQYLKNFPSPHSCPSERLFYKTAPSDSYAAVSCEEESLSSPEEPHDSSHEEPNHDSLHIPNSFSADGQKKAFGMVKPSWGEL